MATEGKGVACPVCGEGFAEAPMRCFRCETDLTLWWPLDESLRRLGEEEVAEPARPRRRSRKRRGWVMPLVLTGGLAGALWLHLESTRPAAETPRPPPPRAAPVPAPPPKPEARTVRYVVQPGDSLWRIAAALKGDARRWPELLASSDGVDPARLRPGQELRLVLDPTSFTGE